VVVLRAAQHLLQAAAHFRIAVHEAAAAGDRVTTGAQDPIQASARDPRSWFRRVDQGSRE